MTMWALVGAHEVEGDHGADDQVEDEGDGGGELGHARGKSAQAGSHLCHSHSSESIGDRIPARAISGNRFLRA
jgi:hypothetical protein